MPNDEETRQFLQERNRRYAAEARARALREVDPTGRMTLESLEKGHETLEVARRRGKKIVVGWSAKGDDGWLPPRGLFMVGEPGVGKTHLAVGIMRELLEKRIRCEWHNVLRFVARVQDTYGASDKVTSRQKILDHVFHNDVVFLDDLGKERESEDVHTLLYELIDGLYVRSRTLVVSSNLTQDQYSRRYDDALKDRIRGMCAVLKVWGTSKRRKGDARYAD